MYVCIADVIKNVCPLPPDTSFLGLWVEEDVVPASNNVTLLDAAMNLGRMGGSPYIADALAVIRDTVIPGNQPTGNPQVVILIVEKEPTPNPVTPQNVAVDIADQLRGAGHRVYVMAIGNDCGGPCQQYAELLAGNDTNNWAFQPSFSNWMDGLGEMTEELCPCAGSTPGFCQTICNEVYECQPSIALCAGLPVPANTTLSPGAVRGLACALRTASGPRYDPTNRAAHLRIAWSTRCPPCNARGDTITKRTADRLTLTHIWTNTGSASSGITLTDVRASWVKTIQCKVESGSRH